jgi:hypothetical protein
MNSLKIIKKLKTLLLILTVPLICGYNNEKYVNLSVNNGNLKFSSDGITIQGARPALLLLIGSERKDTFEWQPFGIPQKESTAIRMTPQGKAEDHIMIWTHKDGYQFEWIVSQLENKSGFTIRANFTNNSKESVILRDFYLLRTTDETVICDGNPSNWMLQGTSYNRRFGNLKELLIPYSDIDKKPGYVYKGAERGVTGEKASDAHWRSFVDAITLYTDDGRRGLVMGAVGPAVSEVRFDCRVNDGRMKLEIVSQMDNILVDAKETRESEEVLVFAQPYTLALATLYHWIATTHHSRTARGPILGWCSWYRWGTSVNETKMKQLINAVSQNREKIPMQVIQIDDGWQIEYGNWTADKLKFPKGMKDLADSILSVGAIPGIWMCPIRTSGPEFIMPDGNKGLYIDPTEVKNQIFIRQSISRLAKDGYRYFKFDFNHIDNTPRCNNKMTRFQMLRDLYKLYREAAGEDAYILACTGYIRRATVGYADAARIGSDAVGIWKSELSPDGLPDNPMNFLECLRTNGSTAIANGILFANDPDVYYLSNDSEEFRTYQSSVGLLGGLAITSDPLGIEALAEPSRLRLCEIMNPVSPEKGRSLNGGTDPFHRQFGFVANRTWGKFASLMVYNKEDTSSDAYLPKYGLEILGNKFHVWSFWDKQYLGIKDNKFTIRSLPAHACKLLRLSPVANDGRPVLIGSDLHITMGAAEIKNIVTDKLGLTIELEGSAGARDGHMYIFCTKPLVLKDVEGCIAELGKTKDNIQVLTLTSRIRSHNQRIVITVNQ